MKRANARLLSFLIGCLMLAGSAPALAEDQESQIPERSWKEYFRRSRTKTPPEEKRSRLDSSTETNPEGMVDLIDIPTTNSIDYGAFRLNFRLYSQGGLQSHLSFGVFRRLNIGATWDNEKVIGSEDPSTNRPTLNTKIRVYDGGEVLPSFAIGYDGQGRFFNKTTDEYAERERGLYGVIGREIFFPGFEAHGGVNIAQFKEGRVLGFVGLSYTIEQMFVLMAEYDNIRVSADNRFNAGFRVFPIPSLGIDFAVRRIGSDKEKERIIRINWVGSF